MHLRIRGEQRKIELIVERGDGGIVAIEIKLANKVDDGDVKQMHWLSGQVGNDLLDEVVIYSRSSAYRRSDGVAVIPACLLGP